MSRDASRSRVYGAAMEPEGVRTAPDWSGSASFKLDSLELAKLARELIAGRLDAPVEVLGIRVLDGEGREIDTAQAVLIVGFRSGGRVPQRRGQGNELEAMAQRT
jgi:hypothetical protein